MHRADGRVSRSARQQCVQALTAVVCLPGGVQAVASCAALGRTSLVALLLAAFWSVPRAGAGEYRGMPPAPVLHACGTTATSRSAIASPRGRTECAAAAARRLRRRAGAESGHHRPAFCDISSGIGVACCRARALTARRPGPPRGGSRGVKRAARRASPSMQHGGGESSEEVIGERESKGLSDLSLLGAFGKLRAGMPTSTRELPNADVRCGCLQPPAVRRGRMDAGSLRLRGGGCWSGALVTRTLFGGAIKLDLPSSFDDVSAFRQVPDHQEVWVDRDSNRSVIVELLDMEEDCQDFEVCEHIFRDCAQANNASDICVLSQRRLRAAEVPKLMRDPPCPKTWISLWLLSGYQSCAKFNCKERDHVHVHMFVARLPNVRTDLCIFFNEPMNTPPKTIPPAASDTEGGAWEVGAQVLADIARSLQV
jgi:hypothetical protein